MAKYTSNHVSCVLYGSDEVNITDLVAHLPKSTVPRCKFCGCKLDPSNKTCSQCSGPA